jgi:hypothetical protein
MCIEEVSSTTFDNLSEECHQLEFSGASHTVNEGLVRIQNKCLGLIYVFPEMKQCSLLISKTEW